MHFGTKKIHCLIFHVYFFCSLGIMLGTKSHGQQYYKILFEYAVAIDYWGIRSI